MAELLNMASYKYSSHAIKAFDKGRLEPPGETFFANLTQNWLFFLSILYLS